jgi:hypothetical protein
MNLDAIAAGLQSNPALIDQLQRLDLLKPLIERELLRECLASAEPTAEESQNMLRAYCQQQGIADEGALHEHLLNRGLRLKDLQWLIEVPLRRDRYSQKAFGAKAEQRFLQRKNDLDRVVYSLIRVSDPFLAQELYLRLAGQESSFSDLAHEFSEGPERQTRGVVGPVPLTQAHPQLAERLRTHAVGALQEPFRIESFWLIVRLEERVAAVFDEPTAQLMSQELFQAWLNEEVIRRLRGLPGTDWVPPKQA